MKKLFTAIVAALFAVPSFAQYSSGGFELDKENVYFGARIGLSLAGIGGDYGLGMKAGLTLGPVIGLRLSDSAPVFLESGVYFTQAGGKKNGVTVNCNNLEVPILVKYGIKASEVAILPFFGPYFSHGFSGKTKWTDPVSGEKVKVGSYAQDDAWGGGLKRNEVGLKFGCGVEYNFLYLEAAFKYCLNNVAKNGAHSLNADMSAHPYALLINFGVNF